MSWFPDDLLTHMRTKLWPSDKNLALQQSWQANSSVDTRGFSIEDSYYVPADIHDGRDHVVLKFATAGSDKPVTAQCGFGSFVCTGAAENELVKGTIYPMPKKFSSSTRAGLLGLVSTTTLVRSRGS